MEKVSALSKAEWIDILHLILHKLGYEIKEINDSKERTDIIALNVETKNTITVSIYVIGERKLGKIPIPLHKIKIHGLSKKEEVEFNKIMLTVRGGG